MALEKIKVPYPIIVEGKYDKIKLSSVIDADIYTTGGFSIFKDKEKQKLIQSLAGRTKLILLTDSDSAGFKIRGFLGGLVPKNQIIHLYIPEIFGKERRKISPSAEGFLGVEGIDTEILLKEFKKAGIFNNYIINQKNITQSNDITPVFLYEIGLSGQANSSFLRREVLKKLDLPQKISSSAMCKVLSRYITKEDLTKMIENIKKENSD